jgi:hypothetical protein
MRFFIYTLDLKNVVRMILALLFVSLNFAKHSHIFLLQRKLKFSYI